MQTQTTQTNPAPLPLDPAILAVLLQTTLDALPHHPAATPAEIATSRQAAAVAVVTLRPRDAMEAILAARVVATHHAAMDCLRCASQPGLPLELKLRCLGKFATLSRLTDATRQALTQAQVRPALQPATVPVPIPAPRPQPALAAAPPATTAPPAAAPPQRAATKPVSAPSLPVRAGDPAHSTIAAATPPGDALGQRMMEEIAARTLTAPIALAA
ncbi:MAG TPA: hypothetical protein VND19_14315 [Acetobacteraceae bacterium]|nr:hypothetical protein [Acetobacteraceae bacterium]